jgi:hypothetical protein
LSVSEEAQKLGEYNHFPPLLMMVPYSYVWYCGWYWVR